MAWKKLYEPTEDEVRELNRNYSGRVRFLVDESIGEAVANYLISMGYNTKYVGDLGLRGRSDEDVFAVAWKDDRVIVTHDPDFLDDQRFPPHRNPGIVVIRPGSDGRDDIGLGVCLSVAIQLTGKNTNWFRGMKFDFSSREEFSIKSPGRRQRYRWRANEGPMIWEE
jgi:predicted nuclease of predicted toxin-antitoxin system